MNSNGFYPVALTIAGSDSGGGAGIQADLRTFAAMGVFGCSAITALTEQNPFGVTGIQAATPENLRGQIRAVLSAFEVRAIKTGMLFSKELIETVAESLDGLDIPLIVDPVMISTSGSRLLREDAIESLMTRILPRAAVITPNRMEAELLTGMTIRTLGDMESAAKLCREKFGCGSVIKGGHSESREESADVCLFGGETLILRSPRLELPELTTHGTGCTFSSALAAGVAKGLDLPEAARNAKRFVYESLLGHVRTGSNLYSMFPPNLRKGFAD